MAQETDTEAEKGEEEIRIITDQPEIDGIEDLDGDVEQYDVGIDNLNDLSRGDLVRYTGEHDPTGWYVVTGRHESNGKYSDETDVIEMRAVNNHESVLLSRPGSVAYLHSLASFGEIEVRTGLRAVATRLVGALRQKRDRIRLRRGLETDQGETNGGVER